MIPPAKQRGRRQRSALVVRLAEVELRVSVAPFGRLAQLRGLFSDKGASRRHGEGTPRRVAAP